MDCRSRAAGTRVPVPSTLGTGAGALGYPYRYQLAMANRYLQKKTGTPKGTGTSTLDGEVGFPLDHLTHNRIIFFQLWEQGTGFINRYP